MHLSHLVGNANQVMNNIVLDITNTRWQGAVEQTQTFDNIYNFDIIPSPQISILNK